MSSAVALYCAHLAIRESTLTMLLRDYISPRHGDMETLGRGLAVEQDLTRPYSKVSGLNAASNLLFSARLTPPFTGI